MTMYIDETVGLTSDQEDQLIELMDVFNVRCEQIMIDGKTENEVWFKPILYKNTTYFITIETIKSLTKFLEFKHLEINNNGFCKFVFKPYNQKIFDQIEYISFRDR